MQISIAMIPDERIMRYDINAICETADSIYWTLVPEEMFRLWGVSPYTYTNDMPQAVSVFDC